MTCPSEIRTTAVEIPFGQNKKQTKPRRTLEKLGIPGEKLRIQRYQTKYFTYLKKFITSITDRNLQEKLIREKRLNLKTTKDLVTQDSYAKRHKQSTIPTALGKEKEMKHEPKQKIQKKLPKNNNTYTGKPPQKKNDCGFCRQQNWTPLHKCRQKQRNVINATRWNISQEYIP